MGNHSDPASYELTDISDIVGTIRDVCINLAIDLLGGVVALECFACLVDLKLASTSGSSTRLCAMLQ